MDQCSPTFLWIIHSPSLLTGCVNVGNAAILFPVTGDGMAGLGSIITGIRLVTSPQNESHNELNRLLVGHAHSRRADNRTVVHSVQ